MTDKKAGNSVHEERMAVFNDTEAWIRSDPRLRASVEEAIKRTGVYYEDDYPPFDPNTVRDEVISVTGERSFQACMRLAGEKPGSRIAVMNFANAFHPGGGVKMGAGAQEESLCRCSTLYPILSRQTLKNSYYAHHRALGDPRATDSLIYTEGVVICKTDDDHPVRLDPEDWVKVDVITIAAPDLRERSNRYVGLARGGTSMNRAELFGCHVKRAIHMLTVAAHRGADTLVPGAFGCGAFRNDPAVVAEAYKVALEVFPKVFGRVVFAVYCTQDRHENYETFKSVLGG